MTKGCQKYSVDLSAYFDGELDEEEEAALKVHLEQCEGCSGSLKRMQSLRNALTSLNRPSLGGRSVLEDLKAKLHLENGLDEKITPKRPN